MSEALRSVLAKFGFEIDSSKLNEAIKQTDNYVSQLRTIAEKIIGGDLKNKVGEWIEQVRSEGDALAKNAVRLGVNAQALQKWQTAAELAGLNSGEIEKAMLMLQRNAAGAATGMLAVATASDMLNGVNAKNAADAFRLLGVQTKDAKGKIKDTPALMQETGLAIARIQDPARRTQIAMQIFGEQGARLAPLFASGEKGLKEALSTLEEFGGGLSDEVLPLTESYTDRLTELKIAHKSLKSALAVELLPILTTWTRTIAKGVAELSHFTRNTNIVKSAVIVFGTAIAWQGREAALAGAKTAIAYAPVALLLAGIILLLDDVITYFKGGKSVIGDLIESLGGKEIAKEIRDDIDDLAKKLEGIPKIGDKIEEALSVVGASLVKFFIEDVPEAIDFMWADISESLGFRRGDFSDLMLSLLTDAKDKIVKGAEDLAASLIFGITEGLDSKYEVIKKAIRKLGDVLKNTFKAFWDAHSPSRVMAADVRTMLGGGVVMGLAKSIPDIEAQARETYAAASLPSGDYAPRIVSGGDSGGGVVNHNTIQQKNEITIDASGGGKANGEAVRTSLTGAMGDDRAAALAALESLGGDD